MDFGSHGSQIHTGRMRRSAALLSALLITSVVLPPADAATAKLGGPCKKMHQVIWIKGVRAQCTWIPAGQGKKGRAVWKALTAVKATATAEELGLPPVPTPTPTGTPTETPSPIATP